jgi:hypothetical protein
VTGAALGLGVGVAWIWFGIGEWLDGPLGNTFAWFILPAIVPLILSPIVSHLSRRPWPDAAVNGLLFFACFYAGYLAPMGLILAAFCFGHS